MVVHQVIVVEPVLAMEVAKNLGTINLMEIGWEILVVWIEETRARLIAFKAGGALI